MTDTQPADVSDLLAEADRTARAMLTGDAESGELLEHAEAAAELLESADPGAVLEGVGLETLPDGSEPSSIPEAIARGDDDHVDELRRLLHLANLVDGDGANEADESAEAATDELEASVAAVRETGAAETVEAGGEDVGQNEADEADDRQEQAGEDGVGGEGQAADDEDADGDEDSTLESAVRSTLEGIDTDLSGVRDRLEAAATTDDSGDESNRGADEESTAGDETAEDEADGDRDADDGEQAHEDEAEDGLLETDLEPDLGSGDGIGSGPSSGRGVARHSTVASSPSDRPDMRGVARFSTMPKRDSK